MRSVNKCTECQGRLRQLILCDDGEYRYVVGTGHKLYAKPELTPSQKAYLKLSEHKMVEFCIPCSEIK